MVIDFHGKLGVSGIQKFNNPYFKGIFDDNLDFTYNEGTSFFDSCGATLNGEFWVFGGNGNQRQLRNTNFNSKSDIFKVTRSCD